MKDEKGLKEEIALNASKEGVREIIFREGDAAIIEPVIKDVDVVLSGTITSCSELYLKRPKQFEEDRAHIIYSKKPEALSIVLKTNEHKEKPHYNVTGKLELSEEMKNFGIVYGFSQNPKNYSTSDLAKLLRFNKRLFQNESDAFKIIEGLSKFTASVQATVSKIDEQRGNKSGHYDVKVDSSIPMAFSLSMPLFKGKPSKKFDIQICFDVRGVNDIILWLESMDLATLIQEDANKYIDEELEKMKNIVQIEI